MGLSCVLKEPPPPDIEAAIRRAAAFAFFLPSSLAAWLIEGMADRIERAAAEKERDAAARQRLIESRRIEVDLELEIQRLKLKNEMQLQAHLAVAEIDAAKSGHPNAWRPETMPLLYRPEMVIRSTANQMTETTEQRRLRLYTSPR